MADKKKLALAKHDKDTGSAAVQIEILTARILGLEGHFKNAPKDKASHRGLITMVNKRKKLLAYLAKTDKATYEETLKKLNLRK
ncbi:MAG: 30S ribosomal protein S15 [Alphaproteobacteria bacterium]|nr:30S ribosomal protein S15 [Alphaproteobacteria bacterium]